MCDGSVVANPITTFLRSAIFLVNGHLNMRRKSPHIMHMFGVAQYDFMYPFHIVSLVFHLLSPNIQLIVHQ